MNRILIAEDESRIAAFSFHCISLFYQFGKKHFLQGLRDFNFLIILVTIFSLY
jgi:hypothetical protein